ncbi:hypothetical protein SAMN04487911_102207 [Arenibacter nanhaiticus]|uniref:Uncharacterized protein n=1 Tax=Arenibacter nanhaiticus TaxID=558155 RepID=A0A1M6BHT0_9FLAO|nr:hypothetical protein [Arenibacter nanhaiticus]SHI48269.1 hypothetical protein SAMN04487911_102207 [Arenibacter nanhaiticus]
MKITVIILSTITVLFSAFKTTKACEYAGSNLGFIQTQTEKAIQAQDINLSKYYAYKALNAITKSAPQLTDCGCEFAIDLVKESANNLKNATKTSSLESARILLNKALENIHSSVEALSQHDAHDSQFSNDVIALNTISSMEENKAKKMPDRKLIEAKIDLSLLRFKESMERVLIHVDCKEARAFAENIFKICEEQLLLPNITESKKYYNLETQKIAAKALEQLRNCAKD